MVCDSGRKLGKAVPGQTTVRASGLLPMGGLDSMAAGPSLVCMQPTRLRSLYAVPGSQDFLKNLRVPQGHQVPGFRNM